MKTRNISLGIVQIILMSLAKYSAECLPTESNERVITNGSCLQIIKRASWSARNVTGHAPLWSVPTPYVVIHHGGIPHGCYDQPSCAKIVRSYQDMHIDKNGWLDIGYQFVIGEDGNVYEGRGWDFIGAHSPGYNTQSIGIAIIGDFSNIMPNEKALNALKSLIASGVALGKISKNYSIIGHRQARDTDCPGQVFYDYITKMPGWTSTPTPVYIKKNDDGYVKESVLNEEAAAAADSNSPQVLK